MAPKQMASVSHTAGREGKSIEQIYQKKTQLEHILLRPDTYVGSTEMQVQELWVFDDVRSQMVNRKINYVPALYKIFDEILVNAADNLIRDPEGMDRIEVVIDTKAGSISVLNNGRGLPVVIHKEHQVFIPEMVFGQLLTSDNYNDGDGKVVGGRNGYGAKLANIFSKHFTVEACDGKKMFTQHYENNMMKRSDPVVVDTKEKSFTRITFKPDLAKFGMSKLDHDIVSLFTKRVYDISGSTAEKCQVHLNGEKLDVKNFRDYTDLYLLTRQGVPQIFEKCSDRWEVCLSLTEGGFQQVSFVNSICTIRGGTHVNHVSDQIIEAITEKVKLESKAKVKGGLDIKPHMVRNHIWVFIKCLVENPAFDGQTKETLTTKQSKFGSKCELSEKFLAEVASCGIVDLILMAAMAKSQVNLGKALKVNTGKVTRLTGVPKLEDANDAGGKNSKECTLILTEGDSAKALAVAGLSVVGRDKFGVFPLRGKVLNVRDATLKQMMSNTEIQSIIKIVGLDLNHEYDEELKGLRYGSIMIMADQDHDGSHIKGLLINLIHAWWPSLAKLPGFLKEFFTPIVKASRGRNVMSFYTMPEYEMWKQASDNGKGFNIKYYKGLGTSTAKEAKEYFSAIESHKISYRHDSMEDDRAIDLAFNKKRADDRKAWINGYEDGNLVDHTMPQVSYSDFVNKELVLFAKANVARAIPSVIDGFKPSQRKVLFACFKRKLKNDCKVAQLVGYVSEHAAYHHGEASLSETIVGMAQDFVGSNNVNLLVPQGQFGTRLQGGKDSASARYIYTRLAPVTRLIFREEDDLVLDYNNEEGMKIEPQWYCPIVPMVLVNGAEGIGTGWATSIPNFDIRDVIANCRRIIKNQDLKEMVPYYSGFQGSIVGSKEEGKYEIHGVISKTGEFTASISELPVKKWTQDYREFLEDNLPKGTKKDGAKMLEDYTEHHTEKNVLFELTLSPEGAKMLGKPDSLRTAFKLRSSMSLNNMVLFDAEGKINVYKTAVDIVKDFAKTRLELYDKRKAFLLARLTRECEVLSAKARFIKLILDGELKIRKRKVVDICGDLRKRGFKAVHEMKGQGGGDQADKDPDAEEDEEEENDGEEGGPKEEDEDEENEPSEKKKVNKGVKDFEYLVGMPISTLTAEKVEELMQQRENKVVQLDALKKKTVRSMWTEELDELEAELDKRDAAIQEADRVEKIKIQKARSDAQGRAKAKGAGKGAGEKAKGAGEKAKGALKRKASNPPEPARALRIGGSEEPGRAGGAKRKA